MLHAVLLAGGAGAGFWPLSRQDRPKQLLPLAGGRSLLQQTLDRLKGAIELERTWVVTLAGLAAAARQQLPQLSEERVLVEPTPRGTAAAVALALAPICSRDPEATVLISPTDHVLRPAAKFRDALREVAERVGRGQPSIVLFGTPARAPRPDLGYVLRVPELSEDEGQRRRPLWPVQSFHEKPAASSAAGWIERGAWWNTGLVVARASALWEELRLRVPEACAAAEAARDGAADAIARYEALAACSLDAGVWEASGSLAAAEADFEWSDVGTWSAIPPLYSQDEAGNTMRDAPVVAVDSRGCLVQGEAGRLVGLLGVEDLVVVQTRDAVLICHKDRAVDVAEFTKALEQEGYSEYL